jgi:hypothetical protein
LGPRKNPGPAVSESIVPAAYKLERLARPRVIEWRLLGLDPWGMRSPSLINRLLASGFVLAGGIAIVLLIWPDGITDLAPDQVTAGAIARAIAAVAAGAISLMVLLTFWDDDFR